MNNPFFKDGDKLVYVVWYDNMEPYEDNFSCIDAIFSSYEEAASFLDSDEARTKTVEVVWEYANGVNCRVRRTEWRYKEPDDWLNPQWVIEIWNITTGKRVLYDNERIFLVENRTDNISHNEEGIGSINPSEADTE